MTNKPGRASVTWKSGDPAEDALRTLFCECGTLKAERFIDLVIAAVDAWEADAIASARKLERRGFDQGYHGGKAEAYGKIAELLRMYPLVKKIVTRRKAGNDG